MTADESPDLPDLPEVPDQALINTEAQLEALRSPVRMRVLNAARKPRSVREIADQLDMPVTRLYYHINLLHDVGFLDVVHTRKSGARLEKLYRVAGKSIVVGPELAKNSPDPATAARALAAVVLEPALHEAESAIADRLLDEPGRPIDLGRSLSVLSPEEAAVISAKIESLVREHLADRKESDHPEAKTYAFTYTFLPTTPQ